MNATRFMMAMLSTACICDAVGADDGAIDKETIKPPTFDEFFLDETTPVAEHFFIRMMGFHIPVQSASGTSGQSLSEQDKQGPGDYYDFDDELVETLLLA